MTEMRPEPPAWLLAKVDQRLAKIRDLVPSEIRTKTDFIMTPLSEPPEPVTDEAMRRWERECDNCHTYCEGEFYTGAVQRQLSDGSNIALMFGACPACARLP